jgi:hypothetical protein
MFTSENESCKKKKSQFNDGEVDVGTKKMTPRVIRFKGSARRLQKFTLDSNAPVPSRAERARG